MDMEKTQFYHRDGRFSPFMIFPLLPIGIFISLLMAVVLYALQNSWYYFFITPLLISAPVWGMVYVTIHFGRCRNIIMAILVGLILFGTYYGGFWLIDYSMFYYYQGEEGLGAVEEIGGSRSPIGYFHFRCRVTVVESLGANDEAPPDPVSGYMFYGAEFLLFFVAAIVFPVVLSNRVYFKDLKRWATSKSFVLYKEDGSKAFQCIVNRDWEALSEIPKMPPTTQSIRVQLCRLKFEFLKNQPDSPIYISLTGLSHTNVSALRFDITPPQRIISSGTIKQWKIEPESAKVLAHYFPELGIKVSVPYDEANLQEADQNVFNPDSHPFGRDSG